MLNGLNEKVCIQVQRVYDSCLQQEQLDEQRVTLVSYGLVPGCGCGVTNDQTAETTNTQPNMPITFESCRSTTTEGTIRNLSVERLCDRPCFARVRCQIDVPIDILFTDSTCREYIGRGVVTVDKDVLLSIPDESIVPYTIEAMVSAICVNGTYLCNNVFELEICVTVVLKVLAKVEILVPSYGFCEVPPCEEFADSVCDESHIPRYPQKARCFQTASRLFLWPHGSRHQGVNRQDKMLCGVLVAVAVHGLVVVHVIDHGFEQPVLFAWRIGERVGVQHMADLWKLRPDDLRFAGRGVALQIG